MEVVFNTATSARENVELFLAEMLAPGYLERLEEAQDDPEAVKAVIASLEEEHGEEQAQAKMTMLTKALLIKKKMK